MDEYSGKRAVVPRKGSGPVLRDTTGNRDQNAQFCNRIGCNGRLNYTKGSQLGCSEKLKSSRSSFHSSSSKEIIGSSTKTLSVVTNARKSFQESRKNLSSHLEKDSSEISSVQDETEVSELPSPGQIRFQSELKDAKSGEVRLMEVGSSSIASNSRPRKIFRQKSGLGNQDTLLGSSIPLASNSSCQGTRYNANASRYGLRNLRCNSISDVLPSGCSSSESNLSRRKDTVKKRNPEGEISSSARGKKNSGPSFKDGRSSVSTSGISISDSRRARNWPPSRDNGVASIRTRKSINGNTRTRLSNQGNGNNLSLTESLLVTPQVPQPEIPIGASVPSSSHQYLAEASPSCSNSYSRPGSNSSDNLPNLMPIGPAELGITRSLANRDGLQALRRYNMDVIAEVLFALERIEHDEELTYEQLLALETNFFLGGLSFYDQHRDMRLDIDNMSYEELLSLEEKMGTVSTALSEEVLSKCLRRSIYQLEDGTMGCNGDEDDNKCSICQEEYVVGDEVGRLECKHGYHMVCIHQWLQLKNLCPICKASAVPSQSSSAS
uniref:RING-type E3 ubiquitin transferase n=1 Tax=Davidia involucrata TaxID=16924 RepID=A0A5B7A9A8_DAVIN